MHFVRLCRNQIGTTLRDSTDDIEGFYHVLLFACGISLPIRSGGQPILVSHLYLLPSSRYTTFEMASTTFLLLRENPINEERFYPVSMVHLSRWVGTAESSPFPIL